MERFISACIDSESRLVALESNLAEIGRESVEGLYGQLWTAGLELQIGNFHLAVGTKGLAWFDRDTFVLFTLNFTESANLYYSSIQAIDREDKEFDDFLCQVRASFDFVRAPLAFLRSDLRICLQNQKGIFESNTSELQIDHELKASYRTVYGAFFRAWESEYTVSTQLDKGELFAQIQITPNWLRTGQFAGFRIEFQPKKFETNQARSESLSELPLKNPNPVLKFSTNGELLFANEAAREILKIGKHSKGDELIQKLWILVSKSRENNVSKVQIDIDKRWFDLGLAHAESESLVYFTEITEERNIKQEYEQTFAQLTAIINSSRSSIILLSPEGEILFFNQRARKEIRKYFGFELEEGMALPEFDTSISKTIEIAIQTAIDGKHQLTYELDFEYLPERKIWFNFMVYPITNQLNEINGVCLSIQNITRTKLVEQETERIRSFYETIINNLPSDIVVFDNAHNYLFLNPHAIRDEELRRWMIGKTDYDFVERRNLDRGIADTRRQRFNEVVATKTMLSFVDEHTKQGHTTYIFRKFYPVVENNEVKLVIGYGVDITAIKEAEIKLISSENRFKGLFENNPMLLFIVDENFIIHELNHAAQQAFMFEEKLKSGANFLDFVGQEYREDFEQKFTEALALNPNETYACYCGLDVHNIQFSIEFTATPVLDDSGNKMLLLAGIDQTARLKSDEKLRESEEFNRLLVKEMPIPFAIIDWDKAVYLNDACRTLIGADENTNFTNQSLFSFVDPAYHASISERLQKRYAGEHNSSALIKIYTLKGEPRYVEMQGGLMKRGDSLLNFVTFIDRTEETRAEQARNQAEERLRQIIGTSLDAIITTTSDGKIVAWNPKAVDLFGYSWAEIEGRSIAHSIFPDALGKELDFAFSNPQKEAIPINKQFEGISIKKDKSLFPIELFITQQMSGDQNFYTFIIRDISPRKEAEKALVESEQKLSLLVASLPVVPYSASIEGRYHFNYLNERVFQLIGYTVEEILSQEGFWISRVNSDDLPQLSKAAQILVGSDETFVEYRLRNAFDIDIWIRETMRKIVDAKGNATGVTGVFQDISYEKSQKERRRIIESTLFEISKEEITTTKSIYAFYQMVFNRLKNNLGISGFSIWLATDEKYHAIESFHLNDESAFLRTNQYIDKGRIDAMLKVVNTVSTDSRDDQIDDNINLNSIFNIPETTSLLLNLVRASAGDNLLMLIEHDGINFSWEYEHFSLITSLSELVSFNLEYFQRIESDSKLREAYRLAKIGAWEIEPEKNRTYWSEAMFEFYGLQDHTSPLSFEQALEYIHPEDKSVFEHAFHELQLNKTPYKIECRHILKDGKIRYFEKSALSIPSGRGNALFMGVTVDVTDKKLAEQEERLRQRRLLITNSVGSAISPASNMDELFDFFAGAFVQSAQVNKVRVYTNESNNVNYAVFYSFPKECNDDKLDACVNLEISSRLNNTPLNTVQVLNQQFPDHLIAPIKMPGREKCYLLICTGNTSAIDADFLSITELVIQILHEKADQIFADNKLRDLNTELTDTNLQLRQYSYIVSHNLRAPVANILGCLNLINDDDPNDSRNKILMDGLKISANAVDSILQDLNKILNIKEDVIKQFEYLRFDAIVKEVMENLKNEIEQIPYSIQTDFKAVEGMMAFKPYLLSVFQNLISNSFRYRRQEKNLELTIFSKAQGHKIELHFIDNGRGIDLQKNRKRLFKLYERFHTDVAGTGLGLNMVQEQTRVLGGSIQIESEIDAGTKFILTFVPKV
jgi:PAS domain S-box-containing protein